MTKPPLVNCFFSLPAPFVFLQRHAAHGAIPNGSSGSSLLREGAAAACGGSADGVSGQRPAAGPGLEDDRTRIFDQTPDSVESHK